MNPNSKIDRKILHEVFDNLDQTRNENFSAEYSLLDKYGSHAATIVFRNLKEHPFHYLTIEVDNFPGPKLYYSSDFPINTYQEFRALLNKIGLEVKFKIKDESIQWPKLKRNHIGCEVVTLHEISNGFGKIPVGTKCIVTKSRGGLSLDAVPCNKCANTYSVSKVEYDCVKLISIPSPKSEVTL